MEHVTSFVAKLRRAALPGLPDEAQCCCGLLDGSGIVFELEGSSRLNTLSGSFCLFKFAAACAQLWLISSVVRGRSCSYALRLRGTAKWQFLL